MKIAGVKIEGPSVEIIPILRNGKEIFLKAQAVLDYEPFYQICPIPMPARIMKPGGEETADLNDKDYIKKRSVHSSLKFEWMFLTSLSATEGLEWETVDMSKPETWKNYDQELKDGGFTEAEVLRITMAITQVQGLTNDKIEEARKRFLASQVAASVK